MAQEQARVLARGGNIAVTQLDGRAFPGIHIQGDTFAELQRLTADTADRLRRHAGEATALEELDSVVEDMAQIIRFYEATLTEHNLQRPYFRETAE